MATLAQIHDALADQLATIDGLRCYPYPPQGASPPVAFVTLRDSERDAMGRRGLIVHSFEVYVFTAESVRPQDGYGSLMEYADLAGSRSVWLAVWDGNDRAAGTFVGLPKTSAHVERFDVLGAEQIDAFEMYGGQFTVQVHTFGE